MVKLFVALVVLETAMTVGKKVHEDAVVKNAGAGEVLTVFINLGMAVWGLYLLTRGCL